MVVFTCNHCGDSLQKPRVAKHYQTTCSRNPIALTCVDCFKDFNLQEYVAHTSCITEEDRYSAKGTQPKVLKGAVKQTEWVNTVNTIIEQQKNAKPGVRNILEALVAYSNLPRKKPKFLNFMKSTFNHTFSMHDTEAVWNLLEAHKQATQIKAKEEKDKNGEAKKVTQKENGVNEESMKSVNEETIENGKSKKKRKNKQTNGTEETPVEKKQKLDETDTTSKKKKKTTPVEENGSDDTPSKTKKKKTSENEETNNSILLEESLNEVEKFSFKQVIQDILTKKSKGLTKERLQNKVFKKYEAIMGPIENQEVLIKKYNKKLKALKNVTCDDNDKYKISSE